MFREAFKEKYSLLENLIMRLMPELIFVLVMMEQAVVLRIQIL